MAFENNTDYGLSAAICRENLGAAFKVTDKLEPGAVHINSMTVYNELRCRMMESRAVVSVGSMVIRVWKSFVL